MSRGLAVEKSVGIRTKPVETREPSPGSDKNGVATRPDRCSAVAVDVNSGVRTIESDTFPFEALSDVAEAESWRKEVYRPIYHVHKWWAQRLGSVFRAAVLGAAPGRRDVMQSFYEPTNLRGLVVFDPFMGSGTTVGEAAKLGCVAVGRDINPVAFTTVRAALGAIDRTALGRAFDAVEEAAGETIRSLYRSADNSGRPCDVLYFFWVKVISCPDCRADVDLFSTYMFARHAYAKKYPTVHIVCPECGDVFAGRSSDTSVSCPACSHSIDPRGGNAKARQATCLACGSDFDILSAVRAAKSPPRHRMYAKLVLTESGEKQYMRTTDADTRAYDLAARRLRTADVVSPIGDLAQGHNTNQATNYNYRHWADFFNARQLLALGLLAKAIVGLPASAERDALALVFSGALEFNNLFASYKGEGTGAVRHMFSHHILKPERMPIEANSWGLPQSSGAFSTLYRSRLLRALDYRERPFEVAAEVFDGKIRGSKVFGISPPLTSVVAHNWAERPVKPGVYLSCGDSGESGLSDESVDLVVTDPPFFDNVHYSELADFFFAWQRSLVPLPEALTTTRQCAEVQDSLPTAFSSKLARVFAECHRVLVDDGLLVFSYHHSRDDGWASLAKAVCDAGFSVVQAHPVKSEMSVATPKAQSNDPIDIDVLIVCRKRTNDRRAWRAPRDVMAAAQARVQSCLRRFNAHGRQLSRSDIKVLLLSTILRELSAGRAPDEVVRKFDELATTGQPIVESLYTNQSACQPRATQLGLYVGQ